MPQSKGISIIIPTYNESSTIKVLLDRIFSLNSDHEMEVIVVDAKNSTDHLSELVSTYDLQYLKSGDTCRAVQLNQGAKLARYDILYFVHADVVLPHDFYTLIMRSLENGHSFGYFRYQFDSKKWLLKINSYFSKFKTAFTGGGDQTFFIKKEIFDANGGFDEGLELCEDFDLYDKLKKKYSYEIIDSKVLVSARKYEKTNYFKVNLINFYILLRFRKGHDTLELKKIYSRLLG